MYQFLIQENNRMFYKFVSQIRGVYFTWLKKLKLRYLFLLFLKLISYFKEIQNNEVLFSNFNKMRFIQWKKQIHSELNW